MIRREEGFTLVELMITVVMFVFVIAAVSQVFTGLLTQFKQQSKIAETNIEGIVGLDMLRRDVANAGFGLPWVIPGTVSYSEAPVANAYSAFNECPPPAATCSSPPKAVITGSGTGWNGSDELVIRGSNVSRSTVAQTWTTLMTGNVKRDGLSGETLAGADGVIVISPGSTAANSRRLVVNSANSADWDTTYGATSNFCPDAVTESYVIYGIDQGNGTLRMPFNRTDYYISTSNVPSRCAPNTGVLMKTVLNQSGTAAGTRNDFLPMLDCVADMQVVFRFDTSVPLDGTAELTTDDILSAGLTAQQVREQLMDIRVYILAHEGQRDPNFTYGVNPVYVGDTSVGLGRNFNFTTVPNPIANWQNYRWKLYTIVVKPLNLRQ